ncbi:uncharacterized protein [Ambystoma mexicanum]|uniref:uncharacterized protein isoform X3 n=1 Tax=Ambystoma mexicanum TaxID=8296 RepID=UPI0037E705C6
MATGEKDLLFESFLKKRKDTMIFTWSKYWFRLRNTTLSFYTGKQADESCLRGKYYIYLQVQSVREVGSTDSNHTFEIVMKNGKRKLLSADSAELRAIWIEFLWKSMQLPNPGRNNSSCTWHDVPSLEQRAEAVGLNRNESKRDLEDHRCEQAASSSNDLKPENQSYIEDEVSASENASKLKSEVEGMKPDGDEENKGTIDDRQSTIYDVPKLKSEGEDIPFDPEKKSDIDHKNSGIYDFPKLKNILNLTVTASHGDQDGGEEDIYVYPTVKSHLFQGEPFDDSEEKSTDSISVSPDEVFGVSTA